MNKIDTVLADYEAYLKRHRMAKSKHIPYLVKWVRRFLDFAKRQRGKSFDEVSLLYGAELGKDAKISDWQLREVGTEELPASSVAGSAVGLDRR